jgi:hypothetical protein
LIRAARTVSKEAHAYAVELSQSSLIFILVLILDNLLGLLGLLGERSTLILIFVVIGGLLGLRLALARGRGGSSGRRSGASVGSDGSGRWIAGLLLELGEALTGSYVRLKNIAMVRVNVPYSLLGLAKLSSNVLPVGVDLSNRDDREKEGAVLSSVPGCHDRFVGLFGLMEEVMGWMCVCVEEMGREDCDCKEVEKANANMSVE